MARIRRKINTHNPVPSVDERGWIKLEPSRIRETLEAYDHWTNKNQIPPIIKELMLVLSIEIERYDSRDRSHP